MVTEQIGYFFVVLNFLFVVSLKGLTEIKIGFVFGILVDRLFHLKHLRLIKPI